MKSIIAVSMLLAACASPTPLPPVCTMSRAGAVVVTPSGAVRFTGELTCASPSVRFDGNLGATTLDVPFLPRRSVERAIEAPKPEQKSLVPHLHFCS
jgi:hypothetical protein